MLKQLSYNSLIDDVKDDVIEMPDGRKRVIVHSDIGLALALSNGKKVASVAVAQLLDSSFSTEVENSLAGVDVSKVDDLSSLVDYANTRWVQFPSDKKAFAESQIERLKQLKEKAKTDEMEKKRADAYQALLKKYNIVDVDS